MGVGMGLGGGVGRVHWEGVGGGIGRALEGALEGLRKALAGGSGWGWESDL